LNGYDFEVSENLYHLLGVLRDGHENQKLLWIDQLCIDQRNINERNNQVSLMSFIYSSAEAVYVWLGNATPETNLGLRMLEQVENCGTPSKQMDEDHMLECPGDVLADQEATGLLATRDLLTREYWTRLWIVQEVVYARSLFLLCGSHQYQFGRVRKRIDFSTLNHKVSRAVEENSGSGVILNTDESNASGAFGASHILPRTLSLLQDFLFMQECRQEQSGGYILSFDAVAAHGWRQCRDPRDRIFGLQSLVAPSRRVEVNYKKSPEEIFDEWVAETDTRARHIPPDPEEVRGAISSLHLAMGLGNISQRQLNELAEVPKHPKQIEQRDEAVSQPSRSGNLSSMQQRFRQNRWQILFSIAVVAGTYWLFTKRLRGAGVPSP
jgi:hypothetical protein